jgi:hypothetical protein
LLRAAESVLPAAQQRRLASLLAKNRRGKLSERDEQALLRLRQAADEVMLRRSYAYLLLKYRGHRVPSLAELRK